MNGLVNCSICGLSYDASDLEDVKRNHPRSHRHFLRCRAAHGVQLYDAREADKRRGDDLVRSGKTMDERVEGALLSLRAWYDRDVLDNGEKRSFTDWAATTDLVEKHFAWKPGLVAAVRKLFPAA